jgi:steroid 5-alpha reductase family enzyme
MNEFLHALWPAFGFAIVLMLTIWWLALRINNLGIVDIAWSYSFLPIAIYFALFTHGDPTRRWLVAGMAGLWSLRLGTHVAIRVIRSHPREDVRYGKFRGEWKARLKSISFGFFQIQALTIGALSTVFLLPCLDSRTGITPLEWTGVAIWFIGLAGESLADSQLKQFRASAANAGRICEAGLWNYSRHPNYFFEWLIWVGFFVFAWDSPKGCFTVFCPALILYFLLRVTGIPLTEEFSLKSKGDAYRRYQQTTSAFVPWFKKTGVPYAK